MCTSDNGMSIAQIPYTMISAVSYAGNSWRGRYQSVVRVGGMWLLKTGNTPCQVFAGLPMVYARHFSYLASEN